MGPLTTPSLKRLIGPKHVLLKQEKNSSGVKLIFKSSRLHTALQMLKSWNRLRKRIRTETWSNEDFGGFPRDSALFRWPAMATPLPEHYNINKKRHNAAPVFMFVDLFTQIFFCWPPKFLHPEVSPPPPLEIPSVVFPIGGSQWTWPHHHHP